jgi:hypothetical protein
MGTAAEQLLNGMYSNYIILAVPLFILAAETDEYRFDDRAPARFCNAVVGRFRGGLAQVNVLQSIIFAGMSGSAIADAAGTGKMMQQMMTAKEQIPRELCRRADGRHRGDRADHPAVDPDRPLCAGFRCLDRLPVSRRCRFPACLMAGAQMIIVGSRHGARISRSKSRHPCASCR